MDPFARKMLFSSFAFAGAMLVLFAVLTGVYVHVKPKCPDRIVSESASPHRQWAAAILERRCGPEAPFISRVSLRPADESLRRGYFSGQANGDAVFTVEQDVSGAGLQLSWTAENELTIACPRCSKDLVRRHDQQWGPVRVQYALP